MQLKSKEAFLKWNIVTYTHIHTYRETSDDKYKRISAAIDVKW